MPFPLLVPAVAAALFLVSRKTGVGTFTTRARDDGSTDVSYQGSYVLTFAPDRKVTGFDAAVPNEVLTQAISQFGLHTNFYEPLSTRATADGEHDALLGEKKILTFDDTLEVRAVSVDARPAEIEYVVRLLDLHLKEPMDGTS